MGVYEIGVYGIPVYPIKWQFEWGGDEKPWYDFTSFHDVSRGGCDTPGYRFSLHVLDSSGHMTDMAIQVATCYLMPVWILFVFPRNVS